MVGKENMAKAIIFIVANSFIGAHLFRLFKE
jgi:hypothetical protein